MNLDNYLFKYYMRRLQNWMKLPVFMIQNINKEKFACPICGYYGPFRDVSRSTGVRRHAECPRCNALERHRIQYLAVDKILKDVNPAEMKMLHLAPEPFFVEYFSKLFGVYETADLEMKGVDHNIDLQELPFADETYDFIFASHVLEHIPNDRQAISELRRILKPSGIAVLPVPLVAEKTIEYPAPNPHEAYHLRAPGYDYFDRFSRFFSKVDRITSDSLPGRFQLFIYEDRSRWPTKECPLRPSMPGERHLDIVPVCYV